MPRLYVISYIVEAFSVRIKGQFRPTELHYEPHHNICLLEAFRRFFVASCEGTN